MSASGSAPLAPALDRVDLERVRALVGSTLFGRDERPPRLGRYTIVSTLGQGAMGRVYLAEDTALRRRVALKVILAGAATPAEKLRRRLRREAKRHAAITHPNVAVVYDVGIEGDQVYVAMEHIAGTNLRQWLGSPRSQPRILEVFVAAGRGLAAAHRRGLIHRDFKPENVLVGNDGRVCVVDFGLATTEASGGPVTEPAAADASGVRRHSATAAAGTPAYMSPETLAGEPADARSDQYSFCVSLYEGLFGRRPFDGGSATQLWAQIEMRPPDLDRDAPTWLRDALARGLARDGSERFETMDALLARLAPPRQARRALTIVGGVGALGVAAAVLWMGNPTRICDGSDALAAAVWNPARRAEIGRAFSAVSFGPQTAERAVPRIDDYTQMWATTRDATCVAARDATDPAAFDRASACFKQRLSALDGMLRRWGQADVGVVEHALEAVARLPDIHACASAEAPAEDPRADALRERMAAARAHGDREDATAALAELDACAREAEALGLDAARLEATISRAALQGRDGSIDEAIAGLEASYFEAQRDGLDTLAAEAAVGVAAMLVGPRSSPLEAAPWVTHALTALQRTPDERIEARARLIRAWVGEKAQRFDAALADAERAVALSSGITHVSAHERKGHILWERGDRDAAEQAYAAAVAACGDQLGPAHPRCALSRAERARGLANQGDLAGAREAYTAAIQVHDAAYGTDHLLTAPMHANLGNLALMAGEALESKASFEKALALIRDAYGPDHERVAQILPALAQAEMLLEDTASARAHMEQALALHVQRLGADSAQAAHIHSALAGLALQEKRFSDTLASATTALDILDRGGYPHPTERASIHHNVAGALQALERRDEALPHQQAVVRLYDEGTGGRHPNVPEALRKLALLHEQLGQAAAARGAAGRFLSVSRARKDAAGIAAALRLTARLDAVLGNWDVARTLAREGLAAVERAAPGGDVVATQRLGAARILWHWPAERGRARALARTAREVAEDPAIAEAIDAWLARPRSV